MEFEDLYCLVLTVVRDSVFTVCLVTAWAALILRFSSCACDCEILYLSLRLIDIGCIVHIGGRF